MLRPQINPRLRIGCITCLAVMDYARKLRSRPQSPDLYPFRVSLVPRIPNFPFPAAGLGLAANHLGLEIDVPCAISFFGDFEMPSPSSAFSPTTISTRSDECAMDDGYRRCVTRCSGTPRLRLPQACVVGLEKRGVSAERAVAEEQSGDEACVIRTIERLVFPPAERAPALHERYPHLEGMEVNIDIQAMIRRAFTPSRLRPSPRA
ncbi:hypothetical protein K438DRAFT_1888438 [Mycena galopus ATCC 62051]|nr:hypothetical protein K438DRAFT_1888438 [Mycena galopus ATCC 62051]